MLLSTQSKICTRLQRFASFHTKEIYLLQAIYFETGKMKHFALYPCISNDSFRRIVLEIQSAFENVNQINIVNLASLHSEVVQDSEILVCREDLVRR